MNFYCTPTSFLCPLTFIPSLRIYSNIPLNSHRNRKLTQTDHHHHQKNPTQPPARGLLFLLPLKNFHRMQPWQGMRWARRSPGPISSFFAHNTPVILRLLSCSHTEKCKRAVQSCCLDVAAFHHKHGTRWESGESDRAMFKFSISGREMKGPWHWERELFRFLVTFYLDLEELPERTFSMRDLCFWKHNFGSFQRGFMVFCEHG